MFEQAVLSNGPLSKRVWTTFAGVTGQVLLVSLAVMIPMIWPEAMPGHQVLLRVFAPGAPPGRAPESSSSAVRVTHTVSRPSRPDAVFVPTSMPPHPAPIIDAPADSGVAYSGVPGAPAGLGNGAPTGVLSDILASATPAIAPVKPPEEHRAAAPAAHTEAPVRIKAGGLVEIGLPIRRVEPQYPALARQARIGGVVELEAVVGTDGRIRELKVKSGHPMLVNAAIEAVRQWIYRPTKLNGDPVEVIAPITVTFRLN